MSVSTKPVELVDRDALLRLDGVEGRHSGGHTSPFLAALFDEWVVSRDHTFLKAVENGEVVGCVVGSSSRCGRFQVEGLRVRRADRGRRIADILLNDVCEAKRDDEVLQLVVGSDNRAMLSVCVRWGLSTAARYTCLFHKAFLRRGTGSTLKALSNGGPNFDELVLYHGGRRPHIFQELRPSELSAVSFRGHLDAGEIFGLERRRPSAAVFLRSERAIVRGGALQATVLYAENDVALHELFFGLKDVAAAAQSDMMLHVRCGSPDLPAAVQHGFASTRWSDELILEKA